MATEYFADSSQATDGGTPTTPGGAKKYFSTLLSGYLSRSLDQTLSLRGGRFYDVSAVGAGMPSLQASHVRIRPYGESGNPCLDARNWIAPVAGQFTLVGSAAAGGAVWSIQVGTTSNITRVWAASTNNGVLLSQRTIGEAIGHVPDAVTDSLPAILAALNVNDNWYGGQSGLGYRLYIWTPSELIDPALYYQGISFVQSGTGTMGFDSMRMTRVQDILWQNIDIIGTRSDTLLIDATDTDNVPVRGIVIEDSNMMGCYLSGIRVRQASTATGLASKLTAVSDVVIRRTTANTNTSPKEQERTTAWSRLSGASDLYWISGPVDNVRIEDSVSINGFHCGATLGTSDANNAETKRSGFRRHKVKAAPWTTYTRAYSSFMCDDRCFIDRCESDGTNTLSQFSGGILVNSTVWKNMRPGIRKQGRDTDGVIAISTFIFDGKNASLGSDRYVQIKPTNVRIYNCSLDSSYGPAIQLNAYYTTAGSGKIPESLAAGSVDIKNMMILDTLESRRGLPVMTTYKESTLTVGEPIVDSTLIYKDGEVPTVEFMGTTYPATSAPGFSNILTDNPKVDAELRPMSDSPLLNAGRSIAVKTDNRGKRFNAKPTIGAFETILVKDRALRKY